MGFVLTAFFNSNRQAAATLLYPLLLTKKSIASIGFIMYDYHNYPSILSFVEGDDSQLKKNQPTGDRFSVSVRQRDASRSGKESREYPSLPR